ncbi:hypothetical protein [Methylobacterium nigriterrae]|uniref:hypothetical protein n=1 Tax=Methylobacterium nigriterrae TaxID=3127512 RepID=UPI0030139EF9
MNDNEFIGESGVPEWAEEIIDKHDLWLRADEPLSAALVLLTDAAADLKEVSMMAFKKQALSPSVMSRLSEIIYMVEDARKLSRLCSDEPAAGTVDDGGDGTLTWEAQEPANH